MSLRLVYIADPMCSWCYGFGPELRKVLARHPGTVINLIMGGLRPFNRQPMSDAFRAMLREHWDHVTGASGLALNAAVLQIEGFVYDTEPACRAVVAARSLDPARAFDYYGAVQAAFYRDAKDVTKADTLVALAGRQGFDEPAFAATLESEATRAQTQHDFAETQRLGVGGFPTLAVGYGDELFLVTAGFVTADVIEQRLAEIDRRVNAAGKA